MNSNRKYYRNITEILHLYDKSQNLLKKEEKYTKIKLNVIENKKKEEMNKMRKNKGITLIALIITIIVMLILVGVVVTVVIQSNLLGTAKTAGDKYKTAYEEEGNMSKVTINGEEYNSLDEYANRCEHEWGEWVIDTEIEREKRTCTKCGEVETRLIVGTKINYQEYIGADGNTLDKMPSYTSQKAKTGHSNDQVFTVANNSGIEWIVLGEENGQIKITTKNIVQPTSGGYTSGSFQYYRLYGQPGYTNFIDELNEISAIYGKGRYADTNKFTVKEGGATGGRSIIMEDLGYNKLTRTAGYIYAKEDHGDGAKIWRYPAGSTPDGTSTTGGMKNTFKYMNLDASTSTAEGEHDWSELTNIGDYVEIKDYTYSRSKNLPTAVCKADTSYWLASRYVRPGVSNMNFSARSVNVNGDASIYILILYSSFDYSNNIDNGVRPVVYLKSDITLNYDSASGYTIQPMA